MVNMDSGNRTSIFHKNLTIRKFGDARLVQGISNKALLLSGPGQFVSMGNQHDICLGNMDLCRHGMLTTFWMRSEGQTNKTMVISNGINGLSIEQLNGQLRAKLSTSTRTWQLETARIDLQRWNQVDVSWHPEKGLFLYVNNRLVGYTNKGRKRRNRSRNNVFDTEKGSFFIGLDRSQSANRQAAYVVLDELDYWYAARDYLLAFGYLFRGNNIQKIAMGSESK